MTRKKPSIRNRLRDSLNLDNQIQRDSWVRHELSLIPKGLSLLDAGCGEQRYRANCTHLTYFGQDFGQYTVDNRRRFDSQPSKSVSPYRYGNLDIVSDIWNLPIPDSSFDVVLCTEVLEHVPYPIATVKELSRVLKTGGLLILTAPSNALRHQDPYFFTSGFSDRWFERILPEAKFRIEKLTELGDYNAWMKVEIARTARARGWIARLALTPSLLYYATRRSTDESRNTMVMGYMLVAVKSEH